MVFHCYDCKESFRCDDARCVAKLPYHMQADYPAEPRQLVSVNGNPNDYIFSSNLQALCDAAIDKESNFANFSGMMNIFWHRRFAAKLKQHYAHARSAVEDAKALRAAAAAAAADTSSSSEAEDGEYR